MDTRFIMQFFRKIMHVKDNFIYCRNVCKKIQ